MRRLIAVIALAMATLAGTAATAQANPLPRQVYNSIPLAYPGNLPSLGVEAYSFAHLGDQVKLVGKKRHLTSARVMFSSWACQSGSWSTACVTDPGATFKTSVTLRLYRASVASPGTGAVPGRLIRSITRTMTFPYRPTASNRCADLGHAGEWYSTTVKMCFNGEAKTAVFNHLGRLGITVPSTVVYSVSYNSDNHGPNPLHGTNSPTDSLNVALAPAVIVGSQVTRGGIWWDTQDAGNTNGDPAYVPGVFSLDAPYTGVSDAGYVPAAMILAN